MAQIKNAEGAAGTKPDS